MCRKNYLLKKIRWGKSIWNSSCGIALKCLHFYYLQQPWICYFSKIINHMKTWARLMMLLSNLSNFYADKLLWKILVFLLYFTLKFKLHLTIIFTTVNKNIDTMMETSIPAIKGRPCHSFENAFYWVIWWKVRTIQ